MSFATRVNKKSRKNAYLPVVKYADLLPEIVYPLTRVQRVNNEYGPTIVIDLNGQNTLFLPRRTVKIFDGEEGETDFQELQQLIAKRKIGFKKSADGVSEFVDLM